jgi:hypothetical protein
MFLPKEDPELQGKISSDTKMSIQKGHMRCVGAADEGASTTSPLSSSSE